MSWEVRTSRGWEKVFLLSLGENLMGRVHEGLSLHHWNRPLGTSDDRVFFLDLIKRTQHSLG